MKAYTKLLFVFSLVALSTALNAQSFTISELLELSSRDQQSVNNAASAKGYNYSGATTSDLSMNHIYNYEEKSKLIYIKPNFPSDLALLGWEFYSPAVYDAMKNDIIYNNYRLVNVEKRNGGRYVSHYYSKPGVDVILTTDKTSPSGVYRVAVRSLNVDKYGNTAAGYNYPVMQDYLAPQTKATKTYRGFDTSNRPSVPDNPNFQFEMEQYLNRTKNLNK